MRKEIRYPPMDEADPNLFVFVFRIDSKTTFELHLKKQIATYMIRNKIGTSPVIAEAKRQEAIIRKNSGYFLKIKVFFLARIKVL